MATSPEVIAQKVKVSIPSEHICPITGQIMIDPVFTDDGHTYEREGIENWLKTNDTSPNTGKKLNDKRLTQNWNKKGEISDFLRQHPELSENELYLPQSWKNGLIIAIKSNKIREVCEYLAKDSRLLTEKLEGRYTAFHLAAQFGSIELTNIIQEYLIKNDKFTRVTSEQPDEFRSIFLQPRLENSSLGSSLPRETQEFLNYVAAGKQGEAEAMLRVNRDLILARGTVTDHAGRIFKEITGFQYAVWALDYNMWEMLKRYLPIKEAREQGEGFSHGSWVGEHGKHVGWDKLIEELLTVSYMFRVESPKEADRRWVDKIGKLQTLLPMHALQEYCQPNRLFSPCPDFHSQYALNRSALDRDRINQLGEAGAFLRGKDNADEVYKTSLQQNITTLASQEGRPRNACCRLTIWFLNWFCLSLLKKTLHEMKYSSYIQSDADALKALLQVRKEQRTVLVTELKIEQRNSTMDDKDTKEESGVDGSMQGLRRRFEIVNIGAVQGGTSVSESLSSTQSNAEGQMLASFAASSSSSMPSHASSSQSSSSSRP